MAIGKAVPLQDANAGRILLRSTSPKLDLSEIVTTPIAHGYLRNTLDAVHHVSKGYGSLSAPATCPYVAEGKSRSSNQVQVKIEGGTPKLRQNSSDLSLSQRYDYQALALTWAEARTDNQAPGGSHGGQGTDIEQQNGCCHNKKPEQVHKATQDHESFSVLRGESDILVPKTSPYHLDYRNLKHCNIHWSACTNNHCMLHYATKTQVGHFPRSSTTCPHNWYACMDDLCAEHLWDKRERSHFPGHVDPTEVLAKQKVKILACSHLAWQLCLGQDCVAHQASKIFHGFGALRKNAAVGIARRGGRESESYYRRL